MAGLKPVTAVVLTPDDDVATVLAAAPEGTPIQFTDGSSGEAAGATVLTRQDIPFGHKVARHAIPAGRGLLRYGHPIGIVQADIQAGDHVHSHNLKSRLSPGAAPAQAAGETLKDVQWLRRVVLDCLKAADIPDAPAANMADMTVEAHLRGVITHGVRRLPPYIDRIRRGSVDAAAEPEIKATGGILMVDGKNGIGHHVATVAADAVSDKARELGVAMAVVRNTNHFGFAGYYASRLAERGQIAMVVSNGTVMVGPPGAKQSLLSNDPIAISAPLGRGGPLGPDGPFELDMATSVTSRANIALAAELGQAIAPGLAQDPDGQPTEDAAQGLLGTLLPFGGEKGFAFLFGLEILCGVLGGGPYGPLLASKESEPGTPEGVGNFLLAIDIDKTIGQDAFRARLADLVARLQALPMADGLPAPRYAGQRRWALRRDRLAGGVPLIGPDLDKLMKLAGDLGVAVD